MSAIKIIGKLNPKQYSEMLDHLTRKKIKNPFIKAENIVVDKKPICASGLFIDNSSKLGFMWGLFYNPKVSKVKLFKAMILCVEEIKNQANKNNLSFVYTITGERALHKLYNNYVKMDICEDNIYSYIMNLKPTKYKILDWIQN